MPGDTARIADAGGEPLPGVAPVAKQQGAYVARVIAARAAGRSVRPFQYSDFGMLATIGHSRAVAHFGRVKLSGFSDLASVVLRAHLFSDRVQKPLRRDAELGVELPQLPSEGRG